MRWRWVLVVWAAWLLLLILALGTAHSETIGYRFTAPTSDQRGCPGTVAYDSLALLPPLPLTGLTRFEIWGVRFRDLDTLMLGDIPCSGCAGDTIGFDLDILPGTMGSLWIRAFDAENNRSCIGSQSVFAVPAQETVGDTIGHGAGLKCEMYADREQTVKVGERVDSTVAFVWGDQAAWLGGSIDNFSMRWSGMVHVPTSGVWNLYVQSDDGRRLWLDGVKVMDFWVPTWSEGQWAGSLAEGDHAIRVDYFEAGGGALCTLQWAGPGQGKSIVPGSRLTH